MTTGMHVVSLPVGLQGAQGRECGYQQVSTTGSWDPGPLRMAGRDSATAGCGVGPPVHSRCCGGPLWGVWNWVPLSVPSMCSSEVPPAAGGRLCFVSQWDGWKWGIHPEGVEMEP